MRFPTLLVAGLICAALSNVASAASVWFVEGAKETDPIQISAPTSFQIVGTPTPEEAALHGGFLSSPDLALGQGTDFIYLLESDGTVSDILKIHYVNERNTGTPDNLATVDLLFLSDGAPDFPTFTSTNPPPTPFAAAFETGGNQTFNWYGLNIILRSDISDPVPEPATLALLGAAVAGRALVRRQGRK